MQVTLTRRRLTLAAAVAVAVVAAPLAYATVAGKGGSSPPASLTRSQGAPLASSPPAAVSFSPQLETATADSPYQYTQIVALRGGGAECPGMSLPAGVNFALTHVLVTATVPLLEVNFQPQFKSGPTTLQMANILVPIDATTSGFGLDHRAATRSFDLVVKPGSSTVGDINFIGFCVTSSPAGSATITVTGQKIVGTPTAASVRDFIARPRAKGAVLRWTTGTESNLLGFNVWRYRDAKGVKVNRTLIQAKRSGEPGGAGYSFVDARPGARRGLSYRLQLVDLQGKAHLVPGLRDPLLSDTTLAAPRPVGAEPQGYHHDPGRHPTGFLNQRGLTSIRSRTMFC
jgi:hypothetical protein